MSCAVAALFVVVREGMRWRGAWRLKSLSRWFGCSIARGFSEGGQRRSISGVRHELAGAKKGGRLMFEGKLCRDCGNRTKPFMHHMSWCLVKDQPVSLVIPWE